MADLRTFLAEMALDPSRFADFLREPESAMEAVELSDEDKAALRSGIPAMIAARLAAYLSYPPPYYSPPLYVTGAHPVYVTAPPPMYATVAPPLFVTAPPTMHVTAPPTMHVTAPPTMHVTAPPPMHVTAAKPVYVTSPPPPVVPASPKSPKKSR